LPELFLRKKKIALREALRALYFSAKLLPKDAVLGLGALWPMVTRRGLSLKRFALAKDTVVTNGHCGTLISLLLMIRNIAEFSNIPLQDFKVAILGVGKMGENLAHVLYGKVATLTLIDINEVRLDFVEKKLKKIMSETDIQKYTNREDFGGMKEVFKNNHIVVCTTSNIKRIIKPEEIPDNSIIIDDYRPEGIPRELSGNRIVLEGGLLRINGIIQNYDYGFGFDENVFGCLAESYLLASDFSDILKPTLGDIDFGNFTKMMAICKELGVEVGDFKCRDKTVEKKRIISIIKSKSDLAATIPYKNICWILKVDDLLARGG
jgi:predicted amino acid dehydrogenase